MIELPAPVVHKAPIDSYLPVNPESSATTRLQISRVENEWPQNLPSTSVPWTSTSLGDAVELRCLACKGILVHGGCVKVWKDLPSEGWAEMMDLWHCHKPNEPEDGDLGHLKGSSKGYAAGSKLLARPGIGLVDTLTFLLDRGDCTGVKVRSYLFRSLFY